MDLADKYFFTERFIKKLNPKGLELLMDISLEIRSIQKEILRITKNLGYLEICRDCGGKCCENSDGHRDEMLDFTFLIPLLLLADNQIKEEIFAIISKQREDFSKCIFKGDDGCLLPADLKPIPCTPFFCDDMNIDFDTDVHGKELAELRNKIFLIILKSDLYIDNSIPGEI